MIEKEKRYYIKGDIPKDKVISKKNIKQVYSNFNPDVRIRKTEQDGNNSFTHTVKYFINDNDREEIEQDIEEDSYNRIFNLLNKKPVNKDRYLIDIGNELIAEYDDFLDTGDKVVEVEFPNEDAMTNFEKPDWFGEEIAKGKMFNKQIFSLLNNQDVYSELREKYGGEK